MLAGVRGEGGGWGVGGVVLFWGERTINVDYPHFFPEAPLARLALRGKVLRGF